MAPAIIIQWGYSQSSSRWSILAIALPRYFPFACASSASACSILSASSSHALAVSISPWRSAGLFAASAIFCSALSRHSAAVRRVTVLSLSARPANVGGPRLSLTGAFNVESQPISLLNVLCIDARGLQCGDVQKYVRAAGVVSDETVTAFGIPHFQFSGRHRVLFPLRLQPQLYKPALIQVALSAGYGM